MKISIIGAGNVGSSCALFIAERELAKEVVLIDININLAEGKALDIYQACSVFCSDSNVKGYTNDFSKTENSDIVIITAGVPRKEGMSRDDLILINENIVKEVTEQTVKYSPKSKIIIVSNPLDVMTYTSYIVSKKNSNEVFGMAGVLDEARYKIFLADEIKCSVKDINTVILGGHGDTMVPLVNYTTISGIPINHFIDKNRLDSVINRTKVGGGEIVKLLGTSAWIAPAISVVRMVEAIVKDQKRIITASVVLNGEYSLKDICLGVPVILGKNGIEKIIELELTNEEKELLYKSANSVRGTMNILECIK